MPSVRCQKEGDNIAQDYVGQKVADILKRKKASIKQVRLPQGSPDWDAFMEMTWEQIEAGRAPIDQDLRSFASC